MQRRLGEVGADLSGTTGPRRWGDPAEAPEAKTAGETQARVTGGSAAAQGPRREHTRRHGVLRTGTPLLADSKDDCLRRWCP